MKLIIRYRKITPELEHYATNKRGIQKLFHKVKVSLRRITPVTISVFRNSLFAIMKTEFKIFVHKDGSKIINVKDGFDIIEEGSPELIESEKKRFEEFLVNSLKDEIKKTEKDLSEKVRASAKKMKYKIIESAKMVYSSLGISIEYEVKK